MSDTITIRPSKFQQRVLLVPEDIDLLLGGGRGGGKTWGEALLVLRHAEKYGSRARVLIVRRTFAGLRDIEGVLREVLGAAYGDGARYNQQDHLFRLPNGATIELNVLEARADLLRYQGRSFTLLVVDEVAQFADLALVEQLRANLRGAPGVPLRVVWSCNPGGLAHAELWKRFISKSVPWRPFRDARSGRDWIYCPSTLEDNEYLDRDEYRSQIQAATSHDSELQRAWLNGDWDISAGSYFGGVLDLERVTVDPKLWTPAAVRKLVTTRTDSFTDAEIELLDPPEGWTPAPPLFEPFISLDFGVSAPSVALIVLRSNGARGPDGFFYPKDSLVVVAEWHHARPGRPNEGSGLSVPRQGESIVEMCEAWGVPPLGVADDACFSRARGHDVATIADEFLEAGVRLYPARKGDRIVGWTRMRTLLSQSGSVDRPGLYISRACEYGLETLPFLERDARKPEDLDSSGPDHWADACRYACLPEAATATVGTVIGW